MNDITNREDISLLVYSFYDKIKTDSVIGYFFTEVKKTNWEHHLPKMVDFWDSIAFGSRSYQGNPMHVHMGLHITAPMETKHFDHWLQLFHSTVDALFEGPKANEIKERAANIRQLMEYKVIHQAHE